MLILFIMFPTLKRLPAVNLGGSGWPKKRPTIDGVKLKKSELRGFEKQFTYPHGEIKVGFETDGADRLLLASIVAYTAIGQIDGRSQFQEATGEEVVGPMPPLFGARKAAQKADREKER